MSLIPALLYTLREDEEYDKAFMLISSETNLSSLEPIRQAGAIAILPKPFTAEELQIALSATVDYLNPEKAILNHFDIEDIASYVSMPVQRVYLK
jgi:two-component system chemotaxis response regulator CheY